MKGPVIYYPLEEMQGKTLKSVKQSKELYESMMEEIDTELHIELDFKNVDSVSKSWIENSLGRILKEHGEEFFVANIRLINYNRNIGNVFKRELGDFIDTVGV
jgi:hypothetical protein